MFLLFVEHRTVDDRALHALCRHNQASTTARQIIAHFAPFRDPTVVRSKRTKSAASPF